MAAAVLATTEFNKFFFIDNLINLVIDFFSLTSLLTLKYLNTSKTPCITNLKRLSSPGLRIYSAYKDIPRVLNGMGVVIVSTSKGLMTDREARATKVGGELLCSIW